MIALPSNVRSERVVRIVSAAIQWTRTAIPVTASTMDSFYTTQKAEMCRAPAHETCDVVAAISKLKRCPA